MSIPYTQADSIPLSPRLTLLASTPVIKQPGTLPYRIVLVLREAAAGDPDRGSDLVVWQQLWSKYSVDDQSKSISVTGNGYFEDGSYFTDDKLDLALARFAERVARMAPFVETIYRDDV